MAIDKGRGIKPHRNAQEIGDGSNGNGNNSPINHRPGHVLPEPFIGGRLLEQTGGGGSGGGTTTVTGTVSLADGTVVGIVGTVPVDVLNNISINPTGQLTKENSFSVAIASDQTVPVSFSGVQTVTGSVSLIGTSSITGAVSITGTPTVSASITGTPAVSISGTPTVEISSVGQTTSLHSIPVVLASDQSPVPVSFSGTQTVTGEVSIAGTSSITGAVSITGTPTVTFGSGASVSITGTPSVAVTSIPPVEISGTPSVSISGTPSVEVTSIPSISGSVSITGTPTVELSAGTSVSITGTPAVSISGTPTVEISSVGQTTSLHSIPVVLASDQSTIPVSISGTQSVAGTVAVSSIPSITGAVSITGTPTVEISGTVPVSFSGTQSVTGSVSLVGTSSITGNVGITGTPAVTISGTPSVAISNTPTVTLSSVGQTLSADSIPVVLASDQSAVPVSGAVSITGTPTITGNVGITGTPTVQVSGTVPVSFSGTQSVTGSVSLIGTSTITGNVGITGTPSVSITGTPSVTGSVAISNSPTVTLSSVGQTLSAHSIPVVIASDQSAVPISGNVGITGTPSVSITGTPSVTGTVAVSSIPSITGAVSITGTPAVTISGTPSVTGSVAISNSPTVTLSSVGQTLSANSIPVVLASDQSAVPVSISGTQSVTGSVSITGTPTVSISSVGQTLSADSIPVVLASDQSTVSVTSPDCVSIFNGVINSLATTAVFDTTGFNIVVIQVTGQWFGNLYVEISNDGTNFFKKPILNDTEKLITDNISANGIYFFRPSSRYFWINPELFNGSANVIIYGRSVNGPDVGDALNLALDQTNNVQLNVAMKNVAQDTANRLIPSDAPQILLTSFNGTTVSPFYVVDTSGYQSIAVQLFGTWAGTISFFTANDTSTQDQIAVAGYSAGGSQAPITTATANGVYQFPCVGRFFIIKMTAYTSGNCQVSAYLRQQPISISFLSTPSVNTSQIGGSGVVNAGVGGMAAVGGNIAVGSAQTANPLVAGAVDTAALTRRILSDATGRLGLSGLDQTNIQRAMNLLTPPASLQNIAQIPINDISQTEGRSNGELLTQVLTELKILNQQLFQLPLVLNNLLQFNTPTAIDEPDQMRNDPTLFSTNT